MSALTCDICGGNLTMNESGEFAVCESCGMKHTKERVKVKVQEVKGTVKIDGPVETVKGETEKNRLKSNIRMFLKLNDLEQAEDLCCEVTKEYPEDVEGWCLRLEILDNDIQAIHKYFENYSSNNNALILVGRAVRVFKKIMLLKDNCAEEELLLTKILDLVSVNAPRAYIELFENNVEDIRALFKDRFNEINYYKDLKDKINNNQKIKNKLKRKIDVKHQLQLDGKCEFLFRNIIHWSVYVPYENDERYEFILDESIEEMLKECEKQIQQEKRKKVGNCQHCGASFKGIFNKVCSKCGKPKDY